MEKGVEFWFDPVCPWTWMTSRWLVEVSRARDFPVTWHPFSLKVLNEGQKGSRHDESHRHGYRMGRVLQAVSDSSGSEATERLYTALGTRLHPGQRTDVEAILAESLADARLPASFAERSDDGELAGNSPDALDAALRESTQEGVRRAGPGVGIPIIAVDGVAFFGPVVSPAPKGDAALQLWDGIVQAAKVPNFYELKRGRDVGVQFD